MTEEVKNIIAWLMSPEGERWSSASFEPALDLIFSFRVESGPADPLSSDWCDAWRSSGDDLVWRYWCHRSTSAIPWTPDLGPEYTDYPQLRTRDD